MNKRFSLYLLIIPILFTVFAVTGHEYFYQVVDSLRSSIVAVLNHKFFFRAGVSLSCAVIVWQTAGQAIRQTKWWVIAGLIVSVFGDWFMVHRGNDSTLFICAISLFFAAHACFCIFCLVNGRIHKWFLLVLLLGYLPFFFMVLCPGIPQPALLAAVLAYLLMSCVSLSAAAGLRLPTIVKGAYMTGIALFVFSDTIIALAVFAKYRDWGFLILPTYFASHVVLALALTLMGSFFDKTCSKTVIPA